MDTIHVLVSAYINVADTIKEKATCNVQEGHNYRVTMDTILVLVSAYIIIAATIKEKPLTTYMQKGHVKCLGSFVTLEMVTSVTVITLNHFCIKLSSILQEQYRGMNMCFRVLTVMRWSAPNNGKVLESVLQKTAQDVAAFGYDPIGVVPDCPSLLCDMPQQC